MGECDARTQGATNSSAIGATEDAAARRTARPGSPCFVSLEALNDATRLLVSDGSCGPSRAFSTQPELQVALPRDAWIAARHVAGDDRAHGRRLGPDALGRLGQRAADLDVPADARDRPARRTSARPALAAAVDGRLRLVARARLRLV